MNIKDGINSAFQSIFSHKLRSLLTLTGIVIGVLAVVTMFSSVYAIKALIKKNMEGMGWDNSIIIFPGSGNIDLETGKTRSKIRRAKQNVPPLNYDDYLALKENLNYKCIYGTISKQSLYRVGNKINNIILRATEVEFFQNKSYPISKGRYFNTYEAENNIPVAVLGYHFAEEYFKDKDPIGQVLVLGSQRFTIVGVLASDVLNTGNGMNFDPWQREWDLKAVYVPLKYGATYLSPARMIHQIYIQSNSSEDYTKLKNEARQILLARHNMYPNFQFMDIGDMILNITQEINKFMDKWNITLIAIASISLIVGGIGLFSTLLISIQERMTEIGIRKSIGATEQDIFFYFIFEALALAFIGAILGVVLAWILIVLIAKGINFPLYLPVQGVAVGIGFSLLVGFLSGIYPAWKATGIDPIQAIYYHE
ncbi:ABC transporter permease [Candidatus Cloacimonas acidaminovorans]|jgi:putative ABC transport system permease protein|uniref:ABC-type transport systems, involved in lipoprotein release, permease components n=1 Tax=Cloacimonas acidaminovorans (strain Evry) TaxID=459349 RepID=B0VJB6_CLOAI|nr:ABC transporter permease [Candidatus Cloacimonas acidaminovorans]CAO81570.1 putative ABC-type transport systems, involved in lipoprotein release, permease components [Candidatus Cloacimonas acidaminovorans str. Evry]HNV62865.1 ABC transporter permease [Candidatus Cloacimonas acidaminovorans]HPV00461.1 ABC transporter permease [Candidatus Cloacimonas acidaminovorans]